MLNFIAICKDINTTLGTSLNIMHDKGVAVNFFSPKYTSGMVCPVQCKADHYDIHPRERRGKSAASYYM